MTNTAESAERNMARRYGFCGNCGTAFTSADDQYCRICRQSEHHTGTAPRSAATRWSWRFLLVIPAFVAGYFVPGMLVRISTELGTLIPGVGVLFVHMSQVGQGLAERGHEFGSNTGRARRCGWFDAVSMRRAVYINSISGLCITKLDVLDGLETIKICTGYKLDGEEIINVPNDVEILKRCEPIYEELSGWSESTFGITDYDQLPENAKNYLRRIEQIIDAPIDIISTGPDRSQTIILRHPFETL